MKDKDYTILGRFRKDARMSLTKMSRKTRIPVSTIYDRMKKMDENGIIEKKTALVDFRKIGYEIKSLMLLETDKDDKKEVQRFLQNYTNVNGISRINNGFDFFVEAIFKSIEGFDEFLKELKTFDIVTKKEFFVMEDVQKETYLTHQENLGLRK